MSDERAEYITGLRALADLLENYPEVGLPYDGVADRPASVYISGLDGDDPLAQAIAYAEAMEGRPTVKFTNHPGRTNFWIEVAGRIHGYHLEVNVRVRDVCELVDGEPMVPPALLALAAPVEQTSEATG